MKIGNELRNDILKGNNLMWRHPATYAVHTQINYKLRNNLNTMFVRNNISSRDIRESLILYEINYEINKTRLK